MHYKREAIGWLSTYTSLEEVQRELDEAKDKAEKGGYTSLELEIEDDYGSLSIVVTGRRPETEAETRAREVNTRTVENNERAIYERLKVKYGKDT